MQVGINVMGKFGINKMAGVSIYLSIGVSIYLSAIGQIVFMFKGKLHGVDFIN